MNLPSIVQSPTQTPNPTASWKTYKNAYFSARYPQSSTFEELNPIPGPTYPKVLSYVKYRDLAGGVVYVSVAENFKNLSLDKILGQGPSLSYLDTYLAGKLIQRVRIDNNEAVLVENVEGIGPGDSGLKFDLITIKDNKVFQLYSFDLSYKDFQQILSTFKFTD